MFSNSTDTLTDEDWEKLKELNIIWRNNFKLCCWDEEQMMKGIAAGIKTFSAYPVRDYQTFHSFVKLGASDIRVAGALAHDLDYISQFDINIRVTANLPATPPNIDPAIGAWFRPEDLYQLEQIDICEFRGSAFKPAVEEALFRIYKLQHQWPGKLELLSDKLPKDVDNRLLPDDFQVRRTSCHQKCLMGSNCKWCYITTHLANQKVFKDELKKNEKS